jgi:hypothetical protein
LWKWKWIDARAASLWRHSLSFAWILYDFLFDFCSFLNVYSAAAIVCYLIGDRPHTSSVSANSVLISPFLVIDEMRCDVTRCDAIATYGSAVRHSGYVFPFAESMNPSIVFPNLPPSFSS